MWSKGFPDPAAFKWIIQYSDNDRSKIAIKSSQNGRYMAASYPEKQGSRFWLSEQLQWWYVYQGDNRQPSAYWLHTNQCPNAGFLHTWNNSTDEGAPVLLHRNREPDGNGNWVGSGFGALEDHTTGMSWRFRPTSEQQQWKANQRTASQQTQQSGLCCNNCGRNCPVYQEAMKEVEATKIQNADAASKRNQELDSLQATIQERMGGLDTREVEIKDREQRCQRRGKQCQDSETALKKRNAEHRAEESKSANTANTSTDQQQQQPRTEMKDEDELAENEQLRRDLEETRKQNDELQQKVRRQSQQQQQLPIRSTLRPPSKTFDFKLQGTQGSDRQLPPPIVPPPQVRPAPTLPRDYNPYLMERYQVGKAAMNRG